MLKSRLRYFLARFWPYLLVLVFGIIVSAGLWTNLGAYAEGDDLFFHITRLKTTTEALADGQLVPQINPSAALGFGYGYNLFYGPILTWFAGFLNLLLNNWVIVFNLTIITCFLASGLTMCYAAKKIFQKPTLATLAGIFYLSAPYFLNNFFARTALGECSAMIAAPLVILGLYELTTKHSAASRTIAFAAAFLLLSHNLSALLLALFSALYLALNFKLLKDKWTWQKIALAILGACGLAAVFLLPMLETYLSGAYAISNSGFVSQYMGSNPATLNAWRLGINAFFDFSVHPTGFATSLGFLAFFTLIAFPLTRKKIKNETLKKFLTSLYILALLCLIMTTVLIDWNLIPSFLRQIQFPGRFLALFFLALSFIFPYILYILVKNHSRKTKIAALVATTFVALATVLPITISAINRHATYDYNKPLDLIELGWQGEYVPLTLNCPVGTTDWCGYIEVGNRLSERGSDLKIQSGDGAIENLNRSGLNFTLDIATNTETALEFPLIYYPGYRATLNDQPLKTSISEDGLLVITIPKNSTGILKVWYGMTPFTTLGLVISLLTIALYLFFALRRHRSLKQILKTLQADEIATVPTETVEGYAVLLDSEPAIRKLMGFKERDFNSGKIFTLIPKSPNEIKKYAIIPKAAKPLIEKYIPGELTLILPKNPDFKHFYYDNFKTIGIRIPNHPLFKELLPESGPLILTSANKKGETPKSYGKKPSTIIDFTTKTPKIIRQGDLKVI